MRRGAVIVAVALVLGSLPALGQNTPAQTGPTYDEVVASPEAHTGRQVTWVVRARVVDGESAAAPRTVFELRERTGSWAGRVLYAPAFKDIDSKIGAAAIDPSTTGQGRLLVGTIERVESIVGAGGTRTNVPVLRAVTIDVLPVAWQIHEPGKANGVSWPVVIKEVRPAYPPGATPERVQGVVQLEVVVLMDGSVGEVRVVKSLDAKLDRTAIEAARAWRFKPGERNGQPVPTIVRLDMEFRIAR